YRLMERYPEALQDFDLAIQLDPKYTWAIANRGDTYRLMERYPEALQDFNLAIQLYPKDTWAIANRGEIYRLMKQYPEALQDFNLAIQLDPKYTWAIAGRGETYLILKKYNQAIEDLSQAIDLDSGDWLFYIRALAYQALNQTETAKGDLEKAIQLAQQQYEKEPKNWNNTFNLAIYNLAAQYHQPATTLYEYALVNGATSDNIHEAIRDLNDFLTIFPDHVEAQSMRLLLQSSV
ncbi:tetratricopeptide repeat protein, partial [Cronbergia sp. UHCC 0137]|uniref:tetratricopeptide repeat protein n=1 Tax=Cronbergia sp. UHCC 0137 TaxID=3110239 RepID=UPI002B1F99D8